MPFLHHDKDDHKHTTLLPAITGITVDKDDGFSITFHMADAKEAITISCLTRVHLNRLWLEMSAAITKDAEANVKALQP